MNASEVLPAERVDCERYFLRWVIGQGQNTEIHASRIKHLIEVHGEPVAVGPKSANTLKEKLLGEFLTTPTHDIF